MLVRPNGGMLIRVLKKDMSSAAAAPARETLSLQRLAVPALVALAFAKFGLHLAGSVRHYGYFRDELYYLDMARHLDWGYVDAAPLIAVYAKLALWMGGSLAALRIIPALAGTALVVLTVLLARELSGGKYSQFLAGLCVLLAPGILLIDSLMTMNATEPLFWMGGGLVVVRILRTGNSRLWLWFGVLMGLGLENKHSTLSFGFAVTLALLLTEHRREFLKPWIWIAGGIALAIFLPNLIWQYQHGFPTIEDLRNVSRTGKNVVLGPLAFTLEQVVTMHPVLFPVWLTGVIYFLREQRWRVLGLTFVIFFVVMELAHAKNYYLFPIYPLAFAGGGVAIERWLAGRAAWTRVGVVVAISAVTIPTIPLATWVFSPERYLAYSRALGFKPHKAEVGHAGPLPQPMGDQFGWPELTADVAGIYKSLPPEQRAKTGIIAGNYGEAGAIDWFGEKYGLPKAISGHQNHYFWGPPKQHYENFITMQWSREDLEGSCASIQEFQHYHPYGMGEENGPIFLCLGATFDPARHWERWKHWN